jgi:hypothetical protein
MDYLTKLIEDGVVDIFPSRSSNSMILNSPSPLRIRTRIAVHTLCLNIDSKSFCKLYDILSSCIPCTVVKVFSVNSCALILFI